MGPYPHTRDGNRFILVATDLFTRWAEAFPLRSSEAPYLTELLQEVFSRFEYPKHVLIDNGTQFIGYVWAESSQRWDCELWRTPLYHPCVNPTERRNQEVQKRLRLHLHADNQRSWDQKIPDILYGLQRRRNAATGVPTSYLLLGKAIAAPGEWRFQNPDERERPREL